MTGRTLSLALLVETQAQQAVLKKLIEDAGHHLACSLLADEFEKEPQYFVADAWLININLGSGSYPRIESWLEGLDQPLIFEEQLEFPKRGNYDLWVKRTSRKLHQLEGSINLERHPKGAAKFIWVLGASTGGPEALKEFFAVIQQPVDVGFIYVQHMNSGFEDTLIDLINKNSACHAFKAKHGDVIPANGVAVIANENWVNVMPNGTLTIKLGATWPGAYSPSINQVFANVARSYNANFGAIVFSGMGDDGADSLKILHQQGGQIWAQDPSSCTIASMPESAIATGVVSKVATPKELAELIVKAN